MVVWRRPVRLLSVRVSDAAPLLVLTSSTSVPASATERSIWNGRVPTTSCWRLTSIVALVLRVASYCAVPGLAPLSSTRGTAGWLAVSTSRPLLS